MRMVLFISGRIKEIINKGGEKISPQEVDEALMRHKAVFQAVCFSVKQRNWERILQLL